MPVIRTPEERFANLPDYPFEPNYIEINGLRVHYVDEGKGETILCLHGEPTWSFLYRKIINALKDKYRLVAPDFIGFGKSDKFTNRKQYTYRMHRDMLETFVKELDLKDVTIVVQDWGGLMGLRIVSMMPERFARLVIMNTGLPTGEDDIPKAFHAWRTFVKLTPSLPIGRLLQGGTATKLPPEVVAAYDAPFPSRKYKAGAKQWPLIVPIKPTMEAAPEMVAAREALAKWDKPCLVMFSDKDPITGGGDIFFREHIPTAKDQPVITIKNGGHFLQEDQGEEIAKQVHEFIERTK